MVEFALIMVVLIPIMVGAVDLGRAYFEYDMLAHAANEGARRASFDRTTANVIAMTQAAGGRLSIPVENVTVTCFVGSTATTRTCSGVALNDVVQVSATTTFTPITPYVADLLPGGTIMIWASARRTFQ